MDLSFDDGDRTGGTSLAGRRGVAGLAAFAVGAALLVCGTDASAATLITDASLLDAGATLEDFEGFSPPGLTPLVSGIMTVDGVRNDGVQIGIVGVEAGSSSSGTRSIGTTAGVDHYTFTFTEAIGQFGVDLFGHQFSKNISPSIDWTTLSLFDMHGDLLESFNIDAVGAFANQYIGFTSDVFNVWQVQIVFAPNRNDAVWIDDVRYLTATVAPVPLPAALPLLGTSLLGLLAIRRRKRRDGVVKVRL